MLENGLVLVVFEGDKVLICLEDDTVLNLLDESLVISSVLEGEIVGVILVDVGKYEELGSNDTDGGTKLHEDQEDEVPPGVSTKITTSARLRPGITVVSAVTVIVFVPVYGTVYVTVVSVFGQLFAKASELAK